ncbi:MAG: zinc-binding dehydrogenase [Kiritimatiellae bacterium]|nr:zinc-binding dehydrogenase [Kiritimatiellia bacterium]
MLALHFLGDGKLEIKDVPRPEPKGREVVVKVKSASICGTDRENLLGPGQPTIPGHENAGEIVAVDKPATARVGDRVAVNCHVTCGHCEHCLNGDLYFCPELKAIGFDRDGGYAEYLLAPEACCTPIPEDISFETASLLVDMLGTPFRAVKRARLVPGAQVGIWGAGPIGLGALMVAQRFGARVAVLDLSDSRLAMAKAFGADPVINPGKADVKQAVADWTGGRGLDVGFDCVGHERVAMQALDVLKKRGTLVVVGVSHKLTLNPWEHLICRELTIFGTRNFNAREFDGMIGLVRSGLPLEKLITHRFPLSRAVEAFDVFRKGECGKVLIVEG